MRDWSREVPSTRPNILTYIICLTMLQAHNLSIESLHLDTTSVSVEGIFDDENEGDFKICHGHSKDHRPDLKQFKIGAAVHLF